MDKATSYVRTPIDAEARGRLRVYWKKLEADSEAINKVYNMIGKTMMFSDFLHKKEKGRARVFGRINAAVTARGARLMAKKLTGKNPAALWGVLTPRKMVWDKPEHPRDEQDCVCFDFFYMGDGIMSTGLWTLEVTRHALGRYLQRSADRDPTEALFAAHYALLDLSDDVLETYQFRLRVGAHSWQCEPCFGNDPSKEINVHIKVRTYLDYDQLSPQQEAELVSTNVKTSGEKIGKSWLLPPPLKHIVELENGMLEVRRRPRTEP